MIYQFENISNGQKIVISTVKKYADLSLGWQNSSKNSNSEYIFIFIKAKKAHISSVSQGWYYHQWKPNILLWPQRIKKYPADSFSRWKLFFLNWW